MAPFLFTGLLQLNNSPFSRDHLKTCLSIAHTVELGLFCLRIIIELGIIYNEGYPYLWLQNT
jgi:hypothetical protein